MSSPHVTDRFSEYLDGTLPTAAFNKVKSHLVFCNLCRRNFEEIKKTSDLLKKTPPVSPSKSLEERILHAVTNESQAPSPEPSTEGGKISWFSSYRGWGLAATGVLFIFILRNIPDRVRETQTETPSHNAEEKIGEDKISMEIRGEDKKIPLEKFDAAPVLKKNASDVLTEYQANRAQKTADEGSMAAPATDRGHLSAQLKSGEKAKTKESIKTIIQPIIFENEIISGNSSGITEPLEKVVSNQKSWTEIWNRHQQNTPEKSAPPSVDFEKNDVILIFAGTQPSGGFHIEITRVLLTQWDNAPARVIRYKIIPPSKDALVTMALTQPFLMKMTPKRSGPTFFKKNR